MKIKIGLLSLGLALACFFVPNVASADSQVRIVRLSQVEGAARIDRNTGSGFERAFLNIPITQGTKIQTQADGRVEVEFEDGTTLRLAPQSLVEFPELALRARRWQQGLRGKDSGGNGISGLCRRKDVQFNAQLRTGKHSVHKSGACAGADARHRRNARSFQGRS
ncbi:MAG: hypothetical protein DMG90_15610 [Acidobacteria bacterium]|nr:MAG: hypothetical protein DMG90_15610 [Acidobacteriota bacterium]